MSALGLVPVQSPLVDEDEEGLYRASDIRALAGVEVVELACVAGHAPHGLLAVVDPGDGSRVMFAAFDWSCGPASPPDGVGDLYRVLFTGEGFAGSLREMRHTNWGEDGYLFYCNRQVVIEALTALGKWFD